MGVASSALRKARTIASVFFSVCPALSARCEDAWMAGPSAIGSVNGMSSSITSAPAFGSALMSASEVSASGSPAVRKVTSAARPCAFSSAKRVSIRVVMNTRWLSLGLSSAPPLPHGGEAHIHGADHQERDRANELHPFLVFDGRARPEQPHLQEIDDEHGREDHQNPAHDLLPIEIDHERLQASTALWFPAIIRRVAPDSPL